MGRSQERGFPPASSHGTAGESREGVDENDLSVPVPSWDFGLIEPDAVKVARPAPRRGGFGNEFPCPTITRTLNLIFGKEGNRKAQGAETLTGIVATLNQNPWQLSSEYAILRS